MQKLKHYGITCVFFITVALLTFSCKSNQAVSNVKNNAISIANTKWSGTDSDGDFYEYHFLADGQVAYKTNTMRSSIVSFKDEEDIWSQNGKKVMIALGNTSIQIGDIAGNKMNGIAWNKDGKTWTFSLQKISK
ncbi:hypothetical protein U8527_05420 [Kordia algicida OT-1]|uniref:Lipoprotein n=1 Tax=Kordia algicida OT-1 TaxID=391587 RepID=A9DMQ7_9FLAO|nr:hypothetical protein [Kordia algicida]EDP97764.1 hypothetical protein KAOT1_21417 [Kordia algicida OT-1]